MSWRASDLIADTSWQMSWQDDEVDALLDHASLLTAPGVVANPGVIDAHAALAPPSILEKAARIRRELIDGHGFIHLPGLDVTSSGDTLAAIAFLLFGRCIGGLRSQNAAGHLLGHVTDVGADVNDPNTRIYQTNQRQTFHTDSTDAVGLLCLRPAKSGGLSMVVSVDAVYKRMSREAPELAERLFEPVATDRRGEQPDGELPWFEIPVLSRCGDRVTGIYQRQYINSARRFATAPKPDAHYVQALDLFDEIMNDPAMYFQMDFAPGDMQFVHNHSLLHDRTGFIDHDDPARRRYLLRVWMSLPGDRELPDVFCQRYGTTTVGDRGGITVPGSTHTIQLPPLPQEL